MNPIGPESIRQYQEDGFLVVRTAADPAEAGILKSEVLGILAEDAVKHAEADAWQKSNRHLRFSLGLPLRSPAILADIQSRVFREIAGALLGEAAELYFTSTITKTPGKNKEVEWHQDDVFEPDGHSPRLICWTSLTDSHPGNGGISVLPGSHRRGILPHAKSLINEFNQVAEGVETASALPLILGAGDLVVFHPHLVHGSPENKTATDRVALMSGYQNPKSEYSARDLKFRLRLFDAD